MIKKDFEMYNVLSQGGSGFKIKNNKKASKGAGKNKEEVMKKIVGFIAVVAIMVIASVAYATPKYVEMSPPSLVGNIVTLGTLPSGYTLTDVVIYDDVRGIPGRSIGAQSSFDLRPGEGFNFVVCHPDGGEFWQMLTSKSVAGTGLWISCGNGGCKYYRPMDGEQPTTTSQR